MIQSPWDHGHGTRLDSSVWLFHSRAHGLRMAEDLA